MSGQQPKFIQARNFKPADGRPIRLLVLHSMEAPEKPDTAERVARWFAGEKAPQASAHYCIDSVEVVQCVLDRDVAWAAPGANHNGIHLELAGYAQQTDAEWADAYSAAVLERAAGLAAVLCGRYGIPARPLGAAELRAGASGIATHVAVTEAFGLSTHTDPGKSFPLQRFCQRVHELQQGGRAA